MLICVYINKELFWKWKANAYQYKIVNSELRYLSMVQEGESWVSIFHAQWIYAFPYNSKFQIWGTQFRITSIPLKHCIFWSHINKFRDVTPKWGNSGTNPLSTEEEIQAHNSADDCWNIQGLIAFLTPVRTVVSQIREGCYSEKEHSMHNIRYWLVTYLLTYLFN